MERLLKSTLKTTLRDSLILLLIIAVLFGGLIFFMNTNFAKENLNIIINEIELQNVLSNYQDRSLKLMALAVVMRSLLFFFVLGSAIDYSINSKLQILSGMTRKSIINVSEIHMAVLAAGSSLLIGIVTFAGGHGGFELIKSTFGILVDLALLYMVVQCIVYGFMKNIKWGVISLIIVMIGIMSGNLIFPTNFEIIIKIVLTAAFVFANKKILDNMQ